MFCVPSSNSSRRNAPPVFPLVASLAEINNFATPRQAAAVGRWWEVLLEVRHFLDPIGPDARETQVRYISSKAP